MSFQSDALFPLLPPPFFFIHTQELALVFGCLLRSWCSCSWQRDASSRRATTANNKTKMDCLLVVSERRGCLLLLLLLCLCKRRGSSLAAELVQRSASLKLLIYEPAEQQTAELSGVAWCASELLSSLPNDWMMKGEGVISQLLLFLSHSLSMAFSSSSSSSSSDAVFLMMAELRSLTIVSDWGDWSEREGRVETERVINEKEQRNNNQSAPPLIWKAEQNAHCLLLKWLSLFLNKFFLFLFLCFRWGVRVLCCGGWLHFSNRLWPKEAVAVERRVQLTSTRLNWPW